MTEQTAQLHRVLSDVKRRWTHQSLLGAWTLGSASVATILAAGLGAIWLAAPDGASLLAIVGLITVLCVAMLARALWPLRRTPSDLQIARFIDERVPGLDDVLVTAVDYAGRSDGSPVMRECLAADATEALRTVDLNRVLPSSRVRQLAFRAAIATAAMVLVAVGFEPSFSRATRFATAYLLPAHVALEVIPGSVKVRAGQPVTIRVRVRGTDVVSPELHVAVGKESRTLAMQPTGEAGVFSITIERVTVPVAYSVSAAQARSDQYTVTPIRPPRVERIDVRYEFPRGLGLEPRTDEDGGDIYGPPGTKAWLTITTDKPIAQSALTLDDGTKVALTSTDRLLQGALTIDDDGSYRVALADLDGLESDGDTEYFIRTLDDRPPDVRIVRPASDRQVTPLEEVQIEARADDDYGIASFDLVFQSANGQQRVKPLGAGKGLTATALHTLFMEELKVQPGDFVTYYARARDVNRGRRSAEARSDIFFLEVKPFEEEFVAAQSQMSGQGGGAQSSMSGLAEAQKEIIVATWKLDARSRRARDAKSTSDIKAISEAQGALKGRAEQANGQGGPARTLSDPRRRRGGPQGRAGDDPMSRAVEAMGQAVAELDKLDTSAALPHELEALNQLLKVEAENQRRQVSRQQQAGNGGGQNRPEADLSSLFDQELRKRQQTNYETPTTTEQREERQTEDPLERIRELARRQDALNRQQRDLARNQEQLAEEELKRQLDRLTREQNELRRQAEQLAQRMQQQGSRQQSQNGQSSGQSSGQSGSQAGGGSEQQDIKRLREISEEMRNAATNLGRQNPEQASASGNRASEQLRDLERQLQSSRPDDRRRALGDLQLEARQLADAQRRLASEAGRTGAGQSGEDARRRLAGEQERLAGRADRLQDNVRRMSRSSDGDAEQRRATQDAARELDRQKLPDRMRQSATALRSPAEGQGAAGQPDAVRQAARQGEDVARSLDRIAERLGSAAGAQDADAKRLSDQLARSQEIREKIAQAERNIAELEREAREGNKTEGQQAQATPAGRQGPQQAQGRSGQGSQQGQNAQPSAEGREGSSGAQGGGDGGRAGRIDRLQREANEQMREAERLAGDLRRENPGMNGGNTPEGWWRSVSAPGTEAFKQDFARWESLKKNLLLALEEVESAVSNQLRVRENQERLNAGGHQGVSEAYRPLVDKYYRSLAAPRKSPQ